jgi:hypothetical protein
LANADPIKFAPNQRNIGPPDSSESIDPAEQDLLTSSDLHLGSIGSLPPPYPLRPARQSFYSRLCDNFQLSACSVSFASQSEHREQRGTIQAV